MHKSWLASGLSALTIFLSGCLVSGPEYQPPRVTLDEGFSGASGDAQLDPTGEVEPGWWELFEDPVLNRLVEQAADNNPDVRIALANLRQARAQRSRSFLDLFPEVTAEAGFVRRRFSPAEFDGPGGNSVELDLYDVGFDARWELDLFGRVRRGVEAREAELQAAEAERRDTLVSVIAELTRNYLELRGIQAGLEVARELAENRREQLELTRIMVDQGRGNELDVAAAKGRLSQALAIIPPLEIDAERAIHRVSVLCGEQPVALQAQLRVRQAIPKAQFPVSLGDPAGLLKRRPDIRAAERKLAADMARIKVASADLFPRVEILGSAGLAADSLSDFDETASRVFSIGPFISWSAFDLLDVKQRIKAADARAEASLIRYEKTVLAALEETENALVGFARNKARRELLEKAHQTSEQAYEIAERRHRAGLDSFLDLLDGRASKLEAKGRLIGAKTEEAEALVAVFKALGTGWQISSVDQRDNRAEVEEADIPAATPSLVEKAKSEDARTVDRWFRERSF